ncbi:hypothetical protein COE51_16300 [Bacillus pseudomycoides]|nr:hypothetical protein COE51_16300 [Bacillus pseudomycoides]
MLIGINTTRYIGSPDLLTSTANQEVIPPPPSNWTSGYRFYDFDFNNLQDCHVKINGSLPIFIHAGNGISVGVSGAPISSLIIVESGIQFTWIASY